MDVLTIFGGPRKKGNTSTVLGWVEEELITLGHEVERINLSSKNINGCIGCMKCKEKQDAPGCVQMDDGNDVIDRMVAGDAVIFASPLYFWGFTAKMKALIDRCYSLYRGVCGRPDHTSFVDGQYQALLMTAADPFERNLEQILTAYQRMLVYNKALCAGELLVCNSTVPDDLGPEIKSQAVKFADQMFDVERKPYGILIPGGAPLYVPRVD